MGTNTNNLLLLLHCSMPLISVACFACFPLTFIFAHCPLLTCFGVIIPNSFYLGLLLCFIERFQIIMLRTLSSFIVLRQLLWVQFNNLTVPCTHPKQSLTRQYSLINALKV